MDCGNRADAIYAGMSNRILSVTTYQQVVMEMTPFSYWFRRRATSNERGAAAVEFAILAPLFFMIVFGMFTGGLAYNEKNQITHAAREGGRYGSVLPSDQFTSTCSTTLGACWATSVSNQTINSAYGDLGASIPGRRICVALVTGNPATVVTASNGNAYWSDIGTGANGSAQPCYADDATGATGERIQVLVQRHGSINAILFNYGLTLTSQATSLHETAVNAS